nr:hypothetical protein [uncultured Pseudomonas sp.]
MNLSWFDDWRFDMRRWPAFHENRNATGRLATAKAPIIREPAVLLHGK